MTRQISRRFFLNSLSAVALTTGPVTAFANAPAASLRPQARPYEGGEKPVPKAADLIDKAGLGGVVAFAVLDAQTGQVLEAHNGTAGLAPASVAKAVTALYALEVLGEGYRFQTRLLAGGPVVNGILQGDLILAGGGDPGLDTDALADMAAEQRRRACAK